MSDASEAFDTIIEASEHAQKTGNQELADALGEAYQTLGDKVLSFTHPGDIQHTVSESADKIVVKTKVKRGTGTRDEDKIDVKVKGSFFHLFYFNPYGPLSG